MKEYDKISKRRKNEREQERKEDSIFGRNR